MLSVRTPMLAMWVAGNRLSDDSIRKILSLTFTDREKKATDGSFVIEDVDYTFTNANVFKKGRRFTFLLGWTAEAMPRGPFIVKSYSFVGGDDGVPRLTVKFQDLSHKMNKKQKRRKHLGKPVNIIRKIAEEHGLGFEIESLSDMLFDDDSPLIQSNTTDAALLQKLATKYGYVWGLEGNTLYFRRPNSLDFTGKQALVPLLSYKSNGSSLRTFNFAVKFQNKGKRKGAAQSAEDIDLDGKASQSIADAALEDAKKLGAAAWKSTRNTLVDVIPGLADIMGIKAGQEGDDQEKKSDTKTKTTKTIATTNLGADRVEWKHIYAEENTKPDGGDKDEDAEETASPPGDDKKKDEQAGVILGTTELIEGTLVPTIASMMYRSSMAVQVTGVGERFSGKHHVTEVTQSYSNGGFATSLKTIKRSFKQSKAGRNFEIQQQVRAYARIQSIIFGGTSAMGPSDSGEAPPTKISTQTDVVADTVTWTTKIIKKVDGKNV